MDGRVKEQFERLQSETSDLYQFLNFFRDWINKTLTNYEIFLEDSWTEGTTIIEYTFKSFETFNSLVFAHDEYRNSQDRKGVWHLGEYVSTSWVVDEPWEKIASFFQENGEPQYKKEDDSPGSLQQR